jgi:hypothetical protein
MTGWQPADGTASWLKLFDRPTAPVPGTGTPRISRSDR